MTPEEYRKRARERYDQKAAETSIRITQPQEVTPDEYAKSDQLARSIGVPTILVNAQYQTFEQKYREKLAETVLKSSPKLTAWLNEGDNHLFASDAIQELSKFEAIVRQKGTTGIAPEGGYGTAWERGVARVPQSYYQFLARGAQERADDKERGFWDILRDEKGPSIIPSPGDVLFAGSRYLTSRLAPHISGDQREAAATYQQKVGEIVMRNAMLAPMSESAARWRERFMDEEGRPVEGSWLANSAYDISKFVSDVAADPSGFLSFITEVAFETAPLLLATGIVTGVTRSPTAGAIFMGAGSGLTEAGMEPAEFFKKHGIDISTPEGALAAVSNTELMNEAIQRGFARGTFIGIMDGLSGGIAGRALAQSPAGNMVLQMLVQAFMGGAGEAGAQILTDGAVDMREVLIEMVAEFATGPIDVTIFGGKSMLDRWRERRRSRLAVDENVEVFDQVTQEAIASKLRARSEPKFREFVERSFQDTQFEDIYIPADKLMTYFQDLGFDPYAFAEEIGGISRDELDIAIAGNSDVRIPTAIYASRIAGSEHDAFIRENMRFSSDDMTAAEANEAFQEALEQSRREFEELQAEWAQMRSFEEEIRETIISRMRVAGRSLNEAEGIAELYVAQITTAAEDEGMTVEDYLREYPLPEFRGALPQGFQPRQADELTRTLAEARSRRAAGLDKRGATLLEFIDSHGGIRDVGGNVRSIIDGTEIKRGRGRKTLKIVRDDSDDATGSLFGVGAKIDDKGRAHGLDDVAQAAIEAGYMADHPLVMEYKAAMERGDQVPDITAALLDAIAEELRGNVQYSADAAVDPDVLANEEYLDNIEEYLASLGVSLADPDDVIRAAVEADQEARRVGDDARMYNQDGTINTESEAFKRWFGDSKVVDENGDPLVVYHGTNADIERRNFRFSEEAIGSANDGGHYGRGFYFTRYRGEAEFYGPKTVEAYLSIRNPLDLSNDTGDLTFAGHFKSWAPKLDAIGALTEDQRQALNAILSADAYVEESITYLRAVSSDGVEGWTARVPNPAEGYTDQIYLRPGFRGEFPSTKDEALEKLKSYFRDEMQRHHPEVYPGLGQENTSLSDYVRTDLGARALTDAAIAAGHDGIFYGDEIVAFRPEQIKSVHNRGTFDPSDPRILFQSRDPMPGGQGNRGAITTLPDGRTIIDIFESADLSTVLHESGHLWLLNLQAREANGSEVAAERIASIKAWWRENANDVARDASRRFPDAQVTAEDVIAAIDNGTTGDAAKDAAIDVGMQEQFARAAEVYLMEGKAPTQELQSAFDRFRSWLLAVYDQILRRVRGDGGAALQVNISPEIRAVFDRILATEEQIAKARERSGILDGVFATAEQLGLTEDEFARFVKLREAVENEDKAKIYLETMRPERVKATKKYRAERESVRAEVEREINSWRQYRAFEWIANQRWLGEDQPENLPEIRLSRQIIEQRYGRGRLLGLSRDEIVGTGEEVKRVRKKGWARNLYAEDGYDPDDVAGLFGFSSGDEMIQALETLPPRLETIEAETDKRMRERVGDPLNDGSIEQAALEAVHSDRRGEWIAAEVNAVAAVAGVEVDLKARDAREVARRTLNAMPVRDAMKSNRFLAAERRAGEEAAQVGRMLARNEIYTRRAQRLIASKVRGVLRGDVDPGQVSEAIDEFNRRVESSETGRTLNDLVDRYINAKRRQLLNHALYAESRNIVNEVERAERYVAKLNRKTTRERIAGAGRREVITGQEPEIDYLDAIDELLERYDFRRISGRTEQRRAGLIDFIERMKAEGREHELEIPEHIERDARRRPYKTLPVEELRGVIDTLKNIEHVANRWNTLVDQFNEMNLAETTDKIASAIRDNLPKAETARFKSGRKKGQFKRTVKGYLNAALNADTIMLEMDGFNDAGPAYEALKAPIDQALDRLAVRKRKAAEDLEKLWSVYSRQEQIDMHVPEYFPALGLSLSKWERLSIALNSGNEGNYERMTNPRTPGHLTQAQVAAVLASLDERDARFVQSVWDFLESFRPDIAKRDRRMKGVEPKWVEPTPVEVGGVLLRGGYYPIDYDPALSIVVADQAEMEIGKAVGFGSTAQTRNGHLKARANTTGRPVNFDIGVIPGHVNQVLYDLELREPVNNTNRLLRQREIRDAFTDAGRQDDIRHLDLWLRDVGTGELRAGDAFNRAARRAKSTFTFAKLAVNLSTVLIQVTGLTQSAVVVGKTNMARALMRMASNPLEARRIVEGKSTFMRTERQTTFNKDIFDLFNDTGHGPLRSHFNYYKNKYGPAAFWLMVKTQYYTVDVPTWMAAYDQGLSQYNGDEAKAVQHADRMVKRAQASGRFADRTAIERGTTGANQRQSDMTRLFTALASYMIQKLNVTYQRTQQMRRAVGEQGLSAQSAAELLSWIIDMMILHTGEALLYTFIKGQWPDEDDEDDTWAKFLVKETAFSVFGSIPFIRDAASFSEGFEAGGAYGGIIADSTKGVKGALDISHALYSMMADGEGEITKRQIKDVISGAGVLTGLPASQINRIVDALWRELVEGEDDVMLLEYLVGKIGKK